MDEALKKEMRKIDWNDFQDCKKYHKLKSKLEFCFVDLAQEEFFDINDIQSFLISALELAADCCEDGKSEYLKLLKLKIEKSPDLLNLL